MRIEVAVNRDVSSSTIKGNLLEDLSEKLLTAQSYDVESQIRLTATELDLLCTHRISGKKVYVECKAYRDKKIDANILKNLVGTLFLKGYDEAWIISTSEFGKDAKGLILEWKDNKNAPRVSFYTPEKVIDTLLRAKVIGYPPTQLIDNNLSSHQIGDWVLLITEYGDFWALTILSQGLPKYVSVFHTNSNIQVDNATWRNIAQTDSSLANLEYKDIELYKEHKIIESKTTSVVQVQIGDEWTDYRPSRPKDFVGRKKEISYLFKFFKKIRNQETDTRIFAITGNSGMGKSSLIAKIRNHAQNQSHKSNIFIYAVDLRAANNGDYVDSALLKVLSEAQHNGFGDQSIELAFSNAASPLNSESIQLFLTSLEVKKQIVVLVFDQFEELYSKPDMYQVFEKAQLLMLETSSVRSNFCLGFAWKTDSTIYNEHPAYFLWHRLSDHRVTRKLAPFSDRESQSILNILEKEIGENLHSDLRYNLVVSSQGYPWLLKKLCIHIFNKIKEGTDQNNLLKNQLSVESLFKEDIETLSASEISCLKVIAEKAPVDWHVIIEISSPDTIKSLIDRRLIIRSGDKLNIYWDIFREYLLTNTVPVIPLRYLPSNDFTSLFKVANCLEKTASKSIAELVRETGFSEGTIQNIGTNMIMFGIANREYSSYTLDNEIESSTEHNILIKVREKLSKHVFTLLLKENYRDLSFTTETLVDLFKTAYPDKEYSEKTFRSYTIRLCRWLEYCGLIESSQTGWSFKEKGEVLTSTRMQDIRKRNSRVFKAPSSPALTLEALIWIESEQIVSKEQIGEKKGYRNAVSTLRRFDLIELQDSNYILNKSKLLKFKNNKEALWLSGNSESILLEVIALLEANIELTGLEIGKYISEKYSYNWTEASQRRNGGGIRQWAYWLYEGKRNSEIPDCPGRLW